MPLIILGTTNPAKAIYLGWLVEDLGLACRSADRLPPAPDESGRSFLDNASLKALHYSGVANALAIASDGGLHIPALGDRWDPLLTHRFAGEAATDAERARALLALMADLHGEQRRAFFMEAVALADHGTLLGGWEAAGEEALVVEAMPDRLIPGFWAGSLLYYPRLGKSGLDAEPTSLDTGMGDQPVAHTSAWAQLRPLVRRSLRDWLDR